MKLIAHRGLLYGPDARTENRPSTLQEALNRGFEVEADVWYDDGWWLGHDEPRHAIDYDFLCRPEVWAHCKNLDALAQATDAMHHFWHVGDEYTLTSRGIVWVYPGKRAPLPRPSVAVRDRMDPAIVSQTIDVMRGLGLFGVCFDYGGLVGH